MKAVPALAIFLLFLNSAPARGAAESSAAADAAHRAEDWLAHPPSLGAPKPFALAQGRTFTLDNGLTVTLLENGRIPKVHISLHVSAGHEEEGDDVWLSDLTAAMLKEGAGGRTAEQIDAAAADMGGQLSIESATRAMRFYYLESGRRDGMVCEIGVLSNRATQALSLLADVVRRPTLPSQAFERVRAKLMRDLAVAKADPLSAASHALRTALYGQRHPQGHVFPTERQLAVYQLDDVRRFYEKSFGARRAHLFVVGRFDAAAAEMAAREAFGGWNAGTEPLQRTSKPAAGTSRVMLIDRPGAPQSNLYLAVALPFGPGDPEAARLLVANTMLGRASLVSRIDRNIREQKGYTYGALSTVQYSSHADGYWVLSAPVTTSITGAALSEILKEIRLLAAQLPPADEIERTQNILIGTFMQQRRAPTDIVDQAAFRELHGLPEDYWASFPDRVRAVTAVDVARVTRERLNPAKLTLVVIADLKQVLPQLRDLPDLVEAGFRIER